MKQSDPIPYFLDGAVQIEQAQGYRAGMDAVLLAAGIAVKSGGLALELGCGAGTALICAAHNNPLARFTGIDAQEDVAELAHANLVRNAMQSRVDVRNMDVLDAIATFGQDRFDAVFFNPPYQDDDQHGTRPAPGKDAAFVARTASLGDWLSAATRLCKSGGHITLIHRAGRLADIVAGLQSQCGDIRVLPITPRKGEEAHRVLVRARKGSRSPSRLLPALHLHGQTRQHAKLANAILQGKAAITFESVKV